PPHIKPPYFISSFQKHRHSLQNTGSMIQVQYDPPHIKPPYFISSFQKHRHSLQNTGSMVQVQYDPPHITTASTI
ncbi:MAG: hypothetical protein ACPGRR_03025, partial [Pseudoalteromonas shioyasakiensis]